MLIFPPAENDTPSFFTRSHITHHYPTIDPHLHRESNSLDRERQDFFNGLSGRPTAWVHPGKWDIGGGGGWVDDAVIQQQKNGRARIPI